MDPAPRRLSTEEEYLEQERASEIKHEFVNGEVYAMAGATIEHNLIASNVTGALKNALRAARRRCVVLGSDQRLHIPATGMYTYADVIVVCGKAQLVGPAPRSLLNPLVIVEVLSESTQDDDHGPKFAHYRSIPSLKEVLFVAQTARRIELDQRLDTGQWLLTELVDGSASCRWPRSTPTSTCSERQPASKPASLRAERHPSLAAGNTLQLKGLTA